MNESGTLRLQTIKIPYWTDEQGKELVSDLRRIQSAAVRSAYSLAINGDGERRKERDVRDLVKRRFSCQGILDSWALHCATRVGLDKRKLQPDGTMIFGGRKNFDRRQKGLISNVEWKKQRLLPFVSLGDSQKLYGNQNIRLLDETTLIVRIARRDGVGRFGKIVTQTATLHLTKLTGNAGKIVREIAVVSASQSQQGRINVTYRLTDTHVCISIDPMDLKQHPERRVPIQALRGRAIGIDLNPNFIGLAIIENKADASSTHLTKLLEHQLVKLDFARDASKELVREALAGVCDRILGLCRKWRIGVISLEKGLGKLRSSTRSRGLNHLLNYWARSLFTAMLTRKARLSGVRVIEIWGAYSSTIGNLAFEAPDACASAAEIARRGLALSVGIKDVLPSFSAGWLSGRWKDLRLPAETAGWQQVHQAIKAAKIGYRRPHPVACPVPGSPEEFVSRGYAVVRLGHKHRPGTLFRPMSTDA